MAFLKEEWTSQVYAPILNGHQLYFAIDQECYQYTAEDGRVNKQQIHELNSGHDEADTRVIFHANFVVGVCYDKTPVIVIRSIDTDVFVLMLHHARFLDANLWMDTGINSKNTRRMIDISHLAIKLTAPICAALPSFHALTGCDYTASFLRKAKWKPFQIMKTNSRFTTAIGHLGDSDVLDPDVVATVEEHVCYVYGVRNLSSVNDARLHLF